MNERVSLLDWGIFHLKQKIVRGEDENVRVDYRFNSNTIWITNSSLTDKTREAAEQRCKEWISDVRMFGSVNEETGEVLAIFLNSNYTDYFKHSGYAEGSQEANTKRLQDLDKKIHLEMLQFIPGGSLTCTGKLLGTGVQISSE